MQRQRIDEQRTLDNNAIFVGQEFKLRWSATIKSDARIEPRAVWGSFYSVRAVFLSFILTICHRIFYI